MSKFNVITYFNVNFIPLSNYCVYYFLFGASKGKYVTDRKDDLELNIRKAGILYLDSKTKEPYIMHSESHEVEKNFKWNFFL